MRKITIRDVAQKAGVSVGTVSAVLNNHGNVLESNRKKVLAAIEKLDYQPSHAARNLRLQQEGNKNSRFIGMLVKEIDNPFYAAVILGAREVLKDRGYALFMTTSEGSYEDEWAMIKALRASSVEALIIAPMMGDRADFSHLFAMKRENFPFVLLGEIKGLPVSMVTADNVKATKMAVQHLFRTGHTRIVHFAGPSYSSQSQYRIQGFCQAFSESHLIFKDDYIIPAGDHLEDGYRAGIQYFKDRSGEDLPTAVTCFNDLVALGVIRALAELSIPVPEAVSVIGYDDIEIGKYQAVPLSTIRTPTREMGRLTAELLLKHLESPGEAVPETAYVQAELIIRGSSRALPTNGEWTFSMARPDGN